MRHIAFQYSMDSDSGQSVFQLFTVVLMILALLVAPAAMGGIAGADSSGTQTQSTDNTFDVTVNETTVEVWDRSVLPLQTDSDAAETSVEAPDLRINDPDGTDSFDVRSDISVFGTDNVPVEYGDRDDADTAQWDGDATLVVAYLDESLTEEDIPDDGIMNQLPSSIAELDDFLADSATAENRTQLNDNVTFAEKDVTIDGDGTFADDVNLADDIDDPFDPGSGQYAMMLSDDPVVEIENNEVQDIADDPGTVIGLEQAAVHADESAIEVDDAEPGDDITVDVDTDLDDADDDVIHAVGIYSEETFTDAEFTLDVTEEFDELGDLDDEDLVLEHSIASVNGIADIATDISAAGMTLSEQEESGEFELQAVIERLADEAGVDTPELEATGDERLDASMTALQGSADGEITVETFEDFDEGEYQVVHVASENDTSQQFETTEEQITIEEEDDVDPDPDEPDLEIIEFDDVSIFEGQQADISAVIENDGDADADEVEVELDIDEVEEDIEAQTVDIGAGDAETVTFESVPTDGLSPDNYTMELDAVHPDTDASDTATATLTVSDTEVDDLDLELDRETIKVDRTTSATVTATFEDGTEEDVTDEATITSANDSIASVDDNVITGEGPGVVTITAAFDGASDTAQLEVLPVPAVEEDEEALNTTRQDLLPDDDDVVFTRSERNSPVYDTDDDETIYGFTGATSVEDVRIGGEIAGDANTSLLASAPERTGEPDDEVLAVSHLDLPEAAADGSGSMLMNVSVDAVDDLDADAEDVEAVRYNDTADEWQTLDAEVVDQDDEFITLRADVPGFSFFALTAEEDVDPDPDDDDISILAILGIGVLLLLIGYILLRSMRSDDSDDDSNSDGSDDSDAGVTESDDVTDDQSS